MAIEPEIKKAMGDAARLIETLLKSQAPKKTGALAKSVQITPKETPKGNIVFQSNYNRYGRFLDWGTLAESAYPNRGKWNPRPGKGTGGIKPRFWTTINAATKQRIKQIMTAATAKVLKTQLRRATK